MSAVCTSRKKFCNVVGIAPGMLMSVCRSNALLEVMAKIPPDSCLMVCQIPRPDMNCLVLLSQIFGSLGPRCHSESLVMEIPTMNGHRLGLSFLLLSASVLPGERC